MPPIAEYVRGAALGFPTRGRLPGLDGSGVLTGRHAEMHTRGTILGGRPLSLFPPPSGSRKAAHQLRPLQLKTCAQTLARPGSIASGPVRERRERAHGSSRMAQRTTANVTARARARRTAGPPRFSAVAPDRPSTDGSASATGIDAGGYGVAEDGAGSDDLYAKGPDGRRAQGSARDARQDGQAVVVRKVLQLQERGASLPPPSARLLRLAVTVLG